jgi:hypothetical protein
VLTFGGYSASGYEDPGTMLVRAERELAVRRPADTLVNIGATSVGIGAVYAAMRNLHGLAAASGRRNGARAGRGAETAVVDEGRPPRHHD